MVFCPCYLGLTPSSACGSAMCFVTLHNSSMPQLPLLQNRADHQSIYRMELWCARKMHISCYACPNVPDQRGEGVFDCWKRKSQQKSAVQMMKQIRILFAWRLRERDDSKLSTVVVPPRLQGPACRDTHRDSVQVPPEVDRPLELPGQATFALLVSEKNPIQSPCLSRPGKLPESGWGWAMRLGRLVTGDIMSAALWKGPWVPHWELGYGSSFLVVFGASWIYLNFLSEIKSLHCPENRS